MFSKKTVRDISVKNQTILLRTDYNVPLSDTGDITDDLRIRSSLPTIQYLLDQKSAKIIIVSHLGRPEGRANKSLSLAPVAIRLQELLPTAVVRFVSENSGPEVEQAVEDLPKGGILLLENLRFSAGEEKNSEDFASEIIDSVHPDLFVQDGFGVIHRAHTSTEAITRLLPSVAGLLVEKEVTTLAAAAENPAHPLLLILGGSKVADKQPLVDKFLDNADHIAIGGKIAVSIASEKSGDPERAVLGGNREGAPIGDLSTMGRETVDRTQNTPTTSQIFIAKDFIEDTAGAKLDIGPVSTGKILDLINTSQTIIWNGLTGKAEDPDFAASSTAIAEAIGQRQNATTIICGGDTSGFVQNLMHTNPSLSYTLVSTGGGVSLELLSGLPLPGLDALEDK